jgi:hypothetical protein
MGRGVQNTNIQLIWRVLRSSRAEENGEFTRVTVGAMCAICCSLAYP